MLGDTAYLAVKRLYNSVGKYVFVQRIYRNEVLKSTLCILM